MKMIMEKGTNETMSGKGRGRNRSISEALEYSMRLSKTMLHPYSKNQFYIPCTFELWTYDAMRTPLIHHIKQNDIDSRGHARQNDINEVHMAHGGTQRNDTQHHGIIRFNISVAHMAHTHPWVQDGNKWHGETSARNMRNVPPWIKCDIMASMNTKYGMASNMTCPH